MEIKLAGTVAESIVDGPGFRYTIFTQGCPHNCEGCHNPETHDFAGGTVADTDDLYNEIILNPLLDGITLSGGDPFCQSAPLADLSRKIHAFEGFALNVIAYTGYTFEYLVENANEENHFMDLLKEVDFLVDGRFILEQRSLDLKFRGSKNQRFIDVKKSLEQNKAVPLSDETLLMM